MKLKDYLSREWRMARSKCICDENYAGCVYHDDDLAYIAGFEMARDLAAANLRNHAIKCFEMKMDHAGMSLNCAVDNVLRLGESESAV